MQKQYVISLEPPHSPIAGCEESCIAVYLASEVDAYREETGATIQALQAGIEQRDKRIAEMEKQLGIAIELFQGECDIVAEPDSYEWLQTSKSLMAR